MKIALVTDGLASGGSERQVVVSAAELARRGHEVEIIAYHATNDFGEFIRRNSIHVTVIESDRSLQLGRVAKLSRYLRARRFDVVHSFKDTASMWGGLAAELARVPTILGGYRSTRRLGALPRAIHRMISLGSTGWVVNTELGRDVVIRDFRAAPDRVFVVHNGVHPDTYESTLTPAEAKAALGIAPDSPVVSIVANLRPAKNHALFFAMAKRLARQAIPATFLVVGNGPKRDEIAALHRRSGLGDRVRLLGHQERIADIWRATDVSVITSFHEGLCSALLEAGAAGLPSVSTENGGASEVLVDGKTGFLTPQDDDLALSARVELLLREQGLRAELGAAARARVMQHFSPDAMADQLIRAYDAHAR